MALALMVSGCGGGGGGGSEDEGAAIGDGPVFLAELNPAVDFFLSSAHYARLITDIDGLPDPLAPLVNPASLIEVDPDTGLLLPGFPTPLNPGADLSLLVPIDFEEQADPLSPHVALVPRNAALVLTFTQSVEVGSVTQPGAVVIVDYDGAPQAHRVLMDPTNPRRVILSAVTPQSPGWKASPLVYDNQGLAVQDPTGELSVVLSQAIKDSNGQTLILPFDQPGSAAIPLHFQPGNAALDAIVLQTDEEQVHFNGFLPDLDPPRIVRMVKATGTISDLSALSVSDASLIVMPVNGANGGLGEWAGARLIVTSPQPGGGALQTSYSVVSSSATGNVVRYDLDLDSPLDPLVSLGDSYVIQRTEFFEPIPGPLPLSPLALAAITVDPDDRPRDPFDPQDAFNSDLRYFLTVLDEQGLERTDIWNPATHTFLPLPPKSSLQIAFNEPMDPSSFGAYESFAVSNGDLAPSDPGFADMRLGQVVLSDGDRRATFEPILEDQFDPQASRFVGFGGTAASHRLVLRTRPEASVVADIVASATPIHQAQLIDLDDYGVLGISDVAGRGLALPSALTDQSDSENFLLASGSPALGAFPPGVDFTIRFETVATADPDFGVVVHRFMGLAQTGNISYPATPSHDTISQGVEYFDYPATDTDLDGNIDRRFLYGPSVIEVGLNVPGQLIGASATSIEHLIDEFNAPKPGAFANPNGDDFLISLGFGLNTPLNSAFGARLQHVYRAADASPSYYEFRDSVLDLVGLAWSPSGGSVVNSTLDDMQILVGLSGVNRGKGPDLKQTNGIPSSPNSGLKQQFDCNLLEWSDNCGQAAITNAQLVKARPSQPTQTRVVLPGTTYVINNAGLFKPANAIGPTGTYRRYIDFPSFNTGFDSTFGREDVFSFPYDSNFPMLIEYRIEDNLSTPSQINRFGYSPGILSSTLPRFRVWSQGQDPLAYGAPNWSTHVAPPFTNTKWFRAGEGGPLVFPDTIAGPIKAPEPNNGMPDIPVPAEYILPPIAENGSPGQPIPDWVAGTVDGTTNSPTLGCITKLPTANSDPLMNTYFANGMMLSPLPNKSAYPGPKSFSPTHFVGYGVPPLAAGPPGSGCVLPSALLGPNTPVVGAFEPGMSTRPSLFGDNARYYMMWKYAKRVSLIESPTIAVGTPNDLVRWHRPIVEPPLSTIAPDADLRVEIRAGAEIDFITPGLDSDYVDSQTEEVLFAVNGPAENRRYVKFRASFGVAPGRLRPPSLQTVILPYEKLKP